MIRITWSGIVLLCCSFSLRALNLNATSSSSSSKILVHPHQHPDPQAVVHDVNRRVNESVTRRQLLAVQVKDQCLTGNPIDDCWQCDPNWELSREHLADCAIGFGREALGGRGGNIYVVRDPSDPDPVNPPPGTLRYGVVQAGSLWIIFSGNMAINLSYELLISSFKTIDGRGANVRITGLGCLIIYDVTNIIIHNVHIHHCKPSGNAKIRISPTQVTERGRSDGDRISVLASSKIWIDRCFLSDCTGGLIDVTEGSTAVTISSNMFTHRDKVMMLGHSDDFTTDSGMQVTVAFNHFGQELKESMPRCRFGYFHVVNNDYTRWKIYAVGSSDARNVTNPSGGGGIVTNPAAPGSSGGLSSYPGRGSNGTIPGTRGRNPNKGIDYGSIFNSEARTPLVPMTSVILYHSHCSILTSNSLLMQHAL
ncbi:hypothetical protein ACJRO7_014920 [Eucalyptus globulus]|uniref:Pectate lyase n=1 Tax=Eucalyptus globulus TaxID=34317 RepID=A0ABD3L7V5_EUCGL